MSCEVARQVSWAKKKVVSLLKVLYHEQKETVSQGRSDRVLLGSQRQTPHSLPQTLDLYGQKILTCLGPQPEVVSAPKTRCVLQDAISELRKIRLNRHEVLLCGQTGDQPLREAGLAVLLFSLRLNLAPSVFIVSEEGFDQARERFEATRLRSKSTKNG